MTNILVYIIYIIFYDWFLFAYTIYVKLQVFQWIFYLYLFLLLIFTCFFFTLIDKYVSEHFNCWLKWRDTYLSAHFACKWTPIGKNVSASYFFFNFFCIIDFWVLFYVQWQIFSWTFYLLINVKWQISQCTFNFAY